MPTTLEWNFFVFGNMIHYTFFVLCVCKRYLIIIGYILSEADGKPTIHAYC